MAETHPVISAIQRQNQISSYSTHRANTQTVLCDHYKTKIEHPCIACSVVDRNQSKCNNCEKKIAYADYAEGKTDAYRVSKALNQNFAGKIRKICDPKKILKELKYSSIKDFLIDLSYFKNMKYVEICDHVSKNTSTICTPNFLMKAMKNNNIPARCSKKRTALIKYFKDCDMQKVQNANRNSSSWDNQNQEKLKTYFLQRQIPSL